MTVVANSGKGSVTVKSAPGLSSSSAVYARAVVMAPVSPSTVIVAWSGTSGFKTGLSQPGRYLFGFPHFPGFESVPSQTITVQRGEPTNHVIQLVRKQL